MSLLRFGISMPTEMSTKFDLLIKKKKYSNRSEAIRDLIRRFLIEDEIMYNGEVIGVVSILYNHHQRELSEKLTAVQHEYHHLVLSAMHIHLDHDNCVEVIITRGHSQKIKNLAETLIATKGVKHGSLNLTSTGKNLQ